MNGRVTHARPMRSSGNMAFLLGLRTAQFNRFKPSALLDRFAEWSAPDIFLASVLGTGTGADDAVQGAAVDFDVFDAHGAVVLNFGSGRELAVSGYFGRNEFGSRFFESGMAGVTADEYVWRNAAGRVRFDWSVTDRSRLKTSIWSGRYRMDQPFSGSPVGPVSQPESTLGPTATVFNEISRFGLRTELVQIPAARVSRTLGLEIVRIDGDFAVRTLPDLGTPDLTPETVGAGPWRITGFADRTWTTSRWGSIRSGLRITSVPVTGAVYAEPRLSWEREVRLASGDRFAYRLSGGLYREFVTQLDIAPYTESALLPGFRVWVPPGSNISPSRAWHSALDATFRRRNGVQFAARAWHKYSPHVVGIDYARPADSDSPLSASRHRSTGGRVSVAADRRTVRAELGASLQSARISHPNRFGSRWLAAPWNAPRTVDLSVDARPAAGWSARLLFAASAGRAWGWRPSYYAYLEPLPEGALPSGFLLSTPENDRLPVHARVDAGLFKTGRLPHGQYSAGITVLNVMDRRNVMDRMLAPESAEPGSILRPVDRLATPRLFLVSLTLSL
ncbi:MAG: hypothetical protein HKN17_07365 [Rhodothermales bacterium]|nr:hypothetical protein [Rhodothermales bacterium]